MRSLIILFVLFLSSSAAYAAEVTNIRMGVHPDKTRIVIDLNGAADFHAVIRNNPRRLSIHLPAKNWQISGDTDVVRPFSSVRHTRVQGNYSEITLPLNHPAVIRNAYMLPETSEIPHLRLVIDVQETSLINFEQAVGRAYGTLTLNAQDRTLDDLLSSLSNQSAVAIMPLVKPKPTRKPIIVIDAGHGGQDPGAISPSGIREKDITLPMAKTIARTLNATGRYDARLTRTRDTFIKLHNRVKIARAANADLFISVHADSVRDHKTSGASFYTLSNTASDAQTAKLAARENRADLIAGVDLDIEDVDVSMILLDLSMRETMNQSKTLANKFVQNFGMAGVPTLQNAHRFAGFAVLKAPDVPSILIETGFVSNETEARNLKNPRTQQQIARAILKSLDHYFSRN